MIPTTTEDIWALRQKAEQMQQSSNEADRKDAELLLDVLANIQGLPRIDVENQKVVDLALDIARKYHMDVRTATQFLTDVLEVNANIKNERERIARVGRETRQQS